LDRIREALHERYAEVIRVADLADDAGVHPVHAARVFRRQMGCTIGQYIRQVRIERACADLVDPTRTLTDIALSTGFSDQAHFTRRFKELTGFTPGRYRRVVLG
jgi:AraC family transcriptional regulator